MISVFSTNMSRSTHLHLVDVGRMVPAAAELHVSFTAAVWDEPLVQPQPGIFGPVCVVVTSTTLKLQFREGEKDRR